jgi:ATP-dependent protease ClpP protease subunit
MSEDNTKSQYCSLVTVKTERKHHSIYVTGEIGDAHEYLDLFALLDNSDPDQDEINVHINSPGGAMSTGVQLCNAIKFSPVEVSCVLEAAAHSVASMIFLSGDEFIVKPGSCMCCHYYSGYSYGKGNEIETHAEFNSRYFQEIYRNIYRGFLTDRELKYLFDGKDYWFNDEEVAKRLKKMVKYREKELDNEAPEQ